MKDTAKLAAMLLTGCALGAGGIHGLHAQASKKPAYVIAEVNVTDPAAFEAYAAKAIQTHQAFGGRLIVPPASADTKEGASVTGKIVIIAFPGLADAEKWYNDPPYHPLIAERQKAAKTRLYLVEGVPQ
jgi:uncharacterized protein (DUF1330 family)